VRRLVTLLAIVGLAYVLRLIGSPANTGAAAAMMLGFILIASYLAGDLATHVRLPRISGYVIFGIVIGPFVLGILSQDLAAALRTVDELALALIALTAGGELRLGNVRRILRPIMAITGSVLLVTTAGIALLVLAARPFLGMLADVPLPLALGLALLLGIWCANSSPDVTVAVVNEAGARGSLTETILSVTIVKDVLVIVLFAVALSLTGSLADPARGFNAGLIGTIAWEVAGALVVGALLGSAFALYLQHVGKRRVLATFLFAYMLILLAHALHVELLLAAVAAGFVIENFSPAGDALIHGIEANSLPVFALFFAVAGAALDLPALLRYWPVALTVVGVRLLLTWTGVRLGGRAGGAPPAVVRLAWLGFISQAGVTLGLSLLVGAELPGVGEDFVAVTAAIIIFHLLLGPVLLKYALDQAGETSSHRTEAAGAETTLDPVPR